MPIETPRTYVNLAFEPDPPRRRAPDKRVIGGIGALAALALAGGFLLGPMMDGQEPVRTAPAPQTKAPAPADGLDIVVDDRPAPEIDASPPEGTTSGILPPVAETSVEPHPREAPPVQSPRAASEAPRQTVTRTPPAPVAAAPVPEPRTNPVPTPPPPVAQAPETRPYTPTPPPTVRRAGRARPSFNCRYARTVSGQMVCADPSLAAADRRLVRAYGQAIRRGVPEPELRRQQDIWLGIRESAARAGPEGVARAYATRTAELDAMAR